MTQTRVKASRNLKSNPDNTKKVVRASSIKPNAQYSVSASSGPMKKEGGRPRDPKADRINREAKDHGNPPKIHEIKLEEIKKRLKAQGIAASRLNKADAYDLMIKCSTTMVAETISGRSTTDYGKKKVDELKEILAQRSIFFRKCSKKAVLVELLEDADHMTTTSDKENFPVEVHKQGVCSRKQPARRDRIGRSNNPTRVLSERARSTVSDLIDTGPTLIQSERQVDIDEYSVLPDSYRVCVNQTTRGGIAYDVWLECQVGKSNEFHHLQVLGDGTKNSYIVLTRWGHHGSRGQLNYLDTGSLERAVSRFNKIFREKTGREWDSLRMTSVDTVEGKRDHEYNYTVAPTTSSKTKDRTYKGNKDSRIEFQHFSDDNPFQNNIPPRSKSQREGSDSDHFDTPCPTPARKR